ncbi:MAG: hypothetical protein HRU15_00435, partial [Planctomycetes bacterium]|nr:hypothetical protein [Planctomycetota bacterium]
GMHDWQAEEAGSKGWVTSKGEQMFYDNKPIKFWGINVCFGNCAPEKEMADLKADMYAKWGINSVRFHKYADQASNGIADYGTYAKLRPDALDLMDYQIAALKKRGIFTKLSPMFHVTLGPADYEANPWFTEFGPKPSDNGRGVNTKSGTVYFLKELQDIQIKQMISLLNHKNPYTGKTYAEDPAIMVVELFNEDSALWNGPLKRLPKIPTMKKRASAAFTEWLVEKYTDEAGIVAAWGAKGLGAYDVKNESVAAKNIMPYGSTWFYDPDQLNGSQAKYRQRLLDTMQWMYKIQNDFYDRYTKAIRDTGYKGQIISSNWQAGRGTSHYLNLHSDRKSDIIDRHNYFGGTKTGGSMLSDPGCAILSSGSQQVSDRPFMLSEWIHVFPNEYGVEGPAIIGAYGMGLQGWDVSYMFQNKDYGIFTPDVGHYDWDITLPNIMPVYTAIARQVRRGDVSESKQVLSRNVHFESLKKGKVSVNDFMQMQHDTKSFDSEEIPYASLAVGKNVVTYTDDYQETKTFKPQDHIKDGGLVSSTKELQWFGGKSPASGYFTMNTKGTKAVVGFAQGKKCQLGDVSITSNCTYGAIYLTAKSMDKNLSNDSSVLIVGVARCRNTGMTYFNGQMQSIGKQPILVEPIKATFTMKRKGTVYICDQNGKRTDQTIPVKNGTFTIDGSVSKSPYWEIVY